MFRKKRSLQAQELIYKSSNHYENKKRWCKLSYYGHISQATANLFPRKEFKIAYHNISNLRALLSNTKDKIDINDRSGIYRLKCSDCETCYIGQTGRSFRLWTEEHRRNLRNGEIDKSHFAKHLWESDHRSDFVPEILHLEKKGRRMDCLEELEIRKHIRNGILANENIFVNYSPLLEIPLKLGNAPTPPQPSPTNA